MNTPHLTLARFNVFALLAAGVLLSAGCANMATTTAANDAATGAEATFTGRVHGGNQPVSGATVQLYAVGQTGVGQGATLYAQSVTSNNGTGSFSFNKLPGNSSSAPAGNTNSYQCPTGSDVLMYVFSAGGNTTGSGTAQQNTAAAFLAPVGYCSQITNSTFVDVSEVTTVATVAAAAQFINPNTDQIGNDGIGVAYQAISNAFSTIPSLVSAANGLANSTTTIQGSGTGVSGITMSVTAPTAQLNTIANIISACVNQASSTGSNCSTLFNNAVPPASSSTQSQPGLTYYAANDTVKAALYMFLNPTDGGSSAARTALFNLQAGAGAPYSPSLTAAPADWLLPITYTTTGTCGSGGGNFFSHPHDLNIDINGNLWIANAAGGNSVVAEMTPFGQAETCVTLGSTQLGGGVVDTNGTIWFADNANGIVYAYDPSNSPTIRTFSAPGATAITADGAGNIFFTEINSGVGSVYEIIGAATINNTNSPVLVASNVGPNPARIFPDSANDIWVSSGAAYVTELVLTPTGQNSHNYASTQIPITASPTYGIMVGPNNRIYVSSQDANSTITVLSPTTVNTTTTYSVLYTTSAANTAGLNKPTQLWIDGAQNVWAGNNTAESGGTYSISELTSNLTAVSASGTTGGFQTSTINAPRTTVVDPVGNVWVLSDNNQNSITEFLGAAVPLYAPYSVGINNGRFQTIP